MGGWHCSEYMAKQSPIPRSRVCLWCHKSIQFTELCASSFKSTASPLKPFRFDDVRRRIQALWWLTLVSRIIPHAVSVMIKNLAVKKSFFLFVIFRKYVIYKIPSLHFLDSQPVTHAEREEARRLGPFLRVVKPIETEVWQWHKITLYITLIV